MVQTLVVGDVIQAKYGVQDSEQGAVGTFYYRVVTVGGTPASLEDFASNFDSRISADLKGLINNNAVYKGVRCQIVNPLPIMVAVLDATGAGAGTAGAIAQSRQTCGLMQFQTLLAGPGGRGRSYLPFPAAADTAGNGVPSVSYLTRAAGLAIQIQTMFSIVGTGTATVQHIIWRRAGNIRTDTVGSTVSLFWATQKRRGSYGRPNTAPA